MAPNSNPAIKNQQQTQNGFIISSYYRKNFGINKHDTLLRSQTTDISQTSTDNSFFRFRLGDLSNLQPFFVSVKFTLCEPDLNEKPRQSRPHHP
ncbi:hypothetical protein HD598_001389 [Neomicrococcus aestuarii]|uniref:Uncharacterized protein n=2 Tax=Neomicrococcus aestuarii TaxID=556325 RepID=A0A7W8TTL8_9MICC|nr:hypothetical protein [Neomicrococcus aestuarii]MBB5512702.1 hypothetical protein [Neomicrococcus aestuarii]